MWNYTAEESVKRLNTRAALDTGIMERRLTVTTLRDSYVLMRSLNSHGSIECTLGSQCSRCSGVEWKKGLDFEVSGRNKTLEACGGKYRKVRRRDCSTDSGAVRGGEGVCPVKADVDTVARRFSATE